MPAVTLETADFSGEALVLRVRTDEGLVGLAECNHCPEAVRALLHAEGSSSWSVGIEGALVGRDPLDVEAIGSLLYRGNAVSARRGLGLALVNAIDVALWDIRAQSQGEPLWRALWGEQGSPPETYATVYTGSGEYDRTLDRLGSMLERLRGLGFSAVKIEPLEDCVPEERIGDFVGTARSALGDEAELLVDFGHRFESAEAAAAWIERLAWARLHLVETPLWIDDLPGYARLAELSSVPIAASELLESPCEFDALLHAGRVAVLQPWVNRVGVTGTLRVAEEAASAGRRCLLAGWNATPIGTAASVHVAAGLGPGLALEHAPTELYDGFPLRRIAAEPTVAGGVFVLPERPGLGVEFDEELVDFYRRP